MTTTLRWKLAREDEPQLALFGRARRRIAKGEYRGLEFLEVETRRIINEVPDTGFLPFRHTINVYRGCSHACTYCFARPSHEYLDLDAGLDFETKIVVKVNAVERVRAETAPGRWSGEPIAMGTNTDPYQPAEGKYGLTRGVIEVLADRANPFSILTKSPLALRDLDVLGRAAAAGDVRVDFSIGTLDEEVWRSTEPGTPHPRRRLAAVARLNAAGVPSGVVMGPVLPGLSDRPDQLEAVVRESIAAGATFVSPILLHLRPGVRRQYLDWLGGARPDLLPLHRSMYRAGAYAPRAEQRRLADLVGDLVRRHGGRTTPRRERTPRAAARRPRQMALEL